MCVLCGFSCLRATTSYACSIFVPVWEARVAEMNFHALFHKQNQELLRWETGMLFKAIF